jgi:hypothetical protein
LKRVGGEFIDVIDFDEFNDQDTLKAVLSVESQTSSMEVAEV